MKRNLSFQSYFGRSIFWLLAISLLVLAAQAMGWLHPPEMMVADAVTLLRNPRVDEHLVSVTIDDEFFEEVFQGRYPLDAGVVKQLLAAIASGSPRLIGVDLETKHWRSDDRRGLPNIPIVWARSARVDGSQRIHPAPVVGGTVDLLSPLVGLAVFPRDRDGIIRRYFRTFSIDRNSLPSFPWALYGAYRDLPIQALLHPPQSEVGLNFTADFLEIQDIPAREVWDAARAPDTKWAERGLIKGKIVLVGGIYSPAHDMHATPFGERSGVQIAAQALSAEINGTGILPASGWVMFVVEISMGVILVVFQYFNRGVSALIISLVIVVLLALLASLLVFRTSALWVNFVPIWVAVFLHNVWEAFKENRHLGRELVLCQSHLRSRTNGEAQPL